MDDDFQMAYPPSLQNIIDGATAGNLSLFIIIILTAALSAWLFPLLLSRIFTSFKLQQSLDEQEMKKRLASYYGLKSCTYENSPHDTKIDKEWVDNYYGINGYLRYNLFQIFYMLVGLIIVFTGFYLAFGLLGMSFLPVLSSFGALTYVGLFHFGDFFRNFYAYGWLIISATLKIGDIIEIDSYGVSGVIKDISLMYMTLFVIDKNASTKTTMQESKNIEGRIGGQWQTNFTLKPPNPVQHVPYKSCKIIQMIIPNFMLTSVPIKINHI